MTAAPAAEAPTPLSHDERRLVTVLFGDVSGFTAMSEKLDPEQVKLIMDRCLKMLADQVVKFDGTVDKFEGDLIMAVWGAPVAHEDDAERAVLAALAMQEGLRAFAEDLQRRRGFSLKMRIGINTGEVISGAVASGRQKDYTVMGDVVNTASRFEGAAEPGTVLVGTKTYALTKHMIEYQELEPIQVKGKSETLAVYRPLGERKDRGQRRGIEGLEARLIGRSHELQILLESFQRVAATKSPHLVTISGVPGIGKSRLLDEFQQYLDTEKESFAWSKGRCLPYGQGIAFYPLAEILKSCFSIKESDPRDVVQERLLTGVRELLEQATGGTATAEALAEEARQITHRLGYTMGVAYPDSELLAINPANIKDELYWAWRRFLAYWATTLPLIIIVEDVHWADQVVLDLLQSVLASLEGAPILFLCLTRPELLEEFPSWIEGENRVFLQLYPLTLEEGMEVLDDLLSPNLLSRAWKERVVASAGGVPFFLEEFLKGLLEEGQIVHGPAGWAAKDTERLPELPDTIYATISARLDRLPSTEKALIQRAAVVGSTFWTSALSYPEPHLEQEDAALRSLVAGHWVAEAPDSAFVGDHQFYFINTLSRESAYKGLTRKTRSQEHQRIAQWLESKVAGRIDEFVELLAYHYGQSTLQEFADEAVEEEPLTKAAVYGWHAGERAFLHHSYRDALTRYDDIMQLLDRLAQQHQDEDPILEERPLSHLRQEVLLHRARVKESLGEYDLALDDLDAVLEQAELQQYNTLKASAHMQKARVLRLKGQTAEAVACAEEAVRLHGESNDKSGEAQALLILGELYSDQAKLADFEVISRHATNLAKESSLLWLEARSLTMLGSACIYQGKMSESGTHLTLAVDHYEDLKDHRGLATSLLMLGRVLHAAGHAAQAIETIERAFTVFDDLGDLPMRVAALATLGQLHIERGNLDVACLYSERGVALARAIGQMGQQIRCLLLVGQAAIAKDQAATAVERLLEAKETCEHSDQAAILPEVYRLLAQAYLGTGEPEVAEQYARLGRQVVEESDQYSQGTTWMALGEVLAGLGRAEEAEEAFQHAQEELEASGEPYEIGEVHLAYAGFLLSNQRQAQARDHLLRAQESFSTLETRDKLEHIAQLQRQLEPVT